MQNAGGYLDQKTRSPLSLGAAVAINGAMVAGLLFASPGVIPMPPGVIELIRPTIAPVPPTIPPPQTEAKTPQKPRSVETVSRTPVFIDPPINPGTVEPYFPPTAIDPPGTGSGFTEIIKPPHDPVMIGVRINPRYANQMQPDYPPGLQREQIQGVVEVRVLVGPDGRVKQVQMISATHPGFFKATEQQALRRWRFDPATKDGVPIEGWRTMTVRFNLDDAR